MCNEKAFPAPRKGAVLKTWAPQAVAVGGPRRAQGKAHLGRRPRDSACHWVMGLDNLASATVRGDPPRLACRVGVRGPALPAGYLESCCPGWALRVPASPILKPSGGCNGKRGPAFLAGLCGGKGHLASSPGRGGGKGGEPVADQPRRGVEHGPAIQWEGAAGRLRPASLWAQRRGIPREVGGGGPLWMLSQDV